MKKRWIVYIIIGIVFGVFDFYYQTFIQGLKITSIPRAILCLGIWLVPLIPIAVYESKISLSRRNVSIASMLTWSISIISYYIFLAVNLLFIGRESSIYLHISNHSSQYFWDIWADEFYNQVILAIIEWLPLALVGGFVIGRLVYFVYTTNNTNSQ